MPPNGILKSKNGGIYKNKDRINNIEINKNIEYLKFIIYLINIFLYL